MKSRLLCVSLTWTCGTSRHYSDTFFVGNCRKYPTGFLSVFPVLSRRVGRFFLQTAVGNPLRQASSGQLDVCPASTRIKALQGLDAARTARLLARLVIVDLAVRRPSNPAFNRGTGAAT